MNLQTAQRFQQLRKEHGLSQEELAEKLYVSRQAVSKWERGEASPDTDNLIQLANLYGITLDELINGKSQQQEETVEDKKDTTQMDENGVYISDDEGNTVKIVDKKGLYLSDAEGNTVFINKGTSVRPTYNMDDDMRKKKRIKGVIDGVTVFGILIAYFLLGFFFDVWHIAWILFLFIPIVDSIGEAIIKRDLNRFAYPVLATVIFLALGSIWGWWHPAWVVFLTIPVYYIVLSPFRKHGEDDEDDKDED